MLWPAVAPLEEKAARSSLPKGMPFVMYRMTSVIEQSPNDARQYRSLQLANGINVLLIHDPEATSPPGTEVEGDADGAAGAKHDTSDDDLDSLVSDDREGSEEVCLSFDPPAQASLQHCPGPAVQCLTTGAGAY